MKYSLGTFLANFSKGIYAFVLTLCLITAANPNDIELTLNTKLQLTRITSACESHFLDITSLAWSADGSRLLFSATSLNGFSQIYSIFPENKGITELTSKRLPHTRRCHHHGGIWYNTSQPAILFSGQSFPQGSLTLSTPELGIGCNLFLGFLENNNFQQLTFLKPSQGALHPLLAPNQQLLVWTQFDGKARTLMSSDLLQAIPFSLPNPRSLRPYKNDVFIEGHQFFPDGKTLLITVTPSSKSPWYGMDICKLEIETNTPTLLTNTPEIWDNYPALSPKGKKILWSSSQNLENPFLGDKGSLWKTSLISELWIMNQDGRNPVQLTTFNTPGTSHFTGDKTYIGPIAWHPTSPNKIAFVLNKHITPFDNQSLIFIATIIFK